MLLLSQHRTMISASPERGLHQIEANADLSHAVDIDSLSDGVVIAAGPLAGYRAHDAGGNWAFALDGRFICAGNDRVSVAVDRVEVGAWERFSLVSEADLGGWQVADAEMQRFAVRVEAMRRSGQPVTIHFGPGLIPIPGYLNVDFQVLAPDFAVSHPESYFTFPYIGNRIAIPDDVVDYVFHEDLIEHVDQLSQIQFLAEVRRILKPGAWHRVNTPDLLHSMATNSDFGKGADGVYTGELQWEHIALFTRSYLKEIADLVGYSEVVFNGKGEGVSVHATPDRRPGPDRDEVKGNIYADLRK